MTKPVNIRKPSPKTRLIEPQIRVELEVVLEGGTEFDYALFAADEDLDIVQLEKAVALIAELNEVLGAVAFSVHADFTYDDAGEVGPWNLKWEPLGEGEWS